MDAKSKAWAAKLLKGIEEAKRKALADQRSNAAYWNGDDWGSASGIKDAEECVNDQVLAYILANAQPKKK